MQLEDGLPVRAHLLSDTLVFVPENPDTRAPCCLTLDAEFSLWDADSPLDLSILLSSNNDVHLNVYFESENSKASAVKAIQSAHASQMDVLRKRAHRSAGSVALSKEDSFASSWSTAGGNSIISCEMSSSNMAHSTTKKTGCGFAHSHGDPVVHLCQAVLPPDTLPSLKVGFLTERYV